MTNRGFRLFIAVLALVAHLGAKGQDRQTISFNEVRYTDGLPSMKFYSSENSSEAIGTVELVGSFKTALHGDSIQFGADKEDFSSVYYSQPSAESALLTKSAGWFNIMDYKSNPSLFRVIPMGGSYIKIKVTQACRVSADLFVGNGCSVVIVEDDRIIYNRYSTRPFLPNPVFPLFYARPGHTYYFVPFFGRNKSDQEPVCRLRSFTFVKQDPDDAPLTEFLTGKLDFKNAPKVTSKDFSGYDANRFYNEYIKYNYFQWRFFLAKDKTGDFNTNIRGSFTLPDVTVSVGGFLPRETYRLGVRRGNSRTDPWVVTPEYQLNETASPDYKFVDIKTADYTKSLYTEDKDAQYFMVPGKGNSYFKRPIQGPSYIVESTTPKRVTLTGFAEEGLGIFITDEMGRPITVDSLEHASAENATYDPAQKAFVTQTHSGATIDNVHGKKVYKVSVSFDVFPGKTYYVAGDDFSTKELTSRNKGMFYLSGIEQTACSSAQLGGEELTLDGSDYTAVSQTTYYPKAVITKKLTANQWSTIVLPFSMTERQVNTTFGDNTAVVALDSIEFSGAVERNDSLIRQFTMKQRAHYYRFIPAGCPVLIKPTLNTYRTDVTVNSVTVEGGVTLVKGQDVIHEWGGDGFVCTGTFSRLESGQLPISSSSPIYFLSAKDRKIKQRTLPMAIPAYSMIYVPKGMKALQSGEVSLGKNYYAEFITNDPDEEDNTDVSTHVQLPTKERVPTVQEGVFNLMGQKVANSPDELSSLPKGLYIVNGRKVLVK